MTLKLVFNAFTSTFDYVDIATAGAPAVPLIVHTGETFTVPDNTQVAHARDIVVEAGGNIVTEGTGVLAWVD